MIISVVFVSMMVVFVTVYYFVANLFGDDHR